MEKLINFIREFRIVKLENNKYVNITSSSKFIKSLASELKLPITNYFLNESQIKMMLNYKKLQYFIPINKRPCKVHRAQVLLFP